ncbi:MULTISPECIES: S-methyl-5'-thioinosine phosphorylase [unclassified Neisseria]|uniref:S-methyl-5'-thioinosine phosphorylase n=1 Tax=unclassified Neisseria TaxID=2623750 RepID=UPI00266590BE|nr:MULTISPECIES: S-methyl-5'-thioinosine phosphorylase [unclassified Neisseria]MDO1510181.1 S-methyl-5'-thioinosine phosphorylase [Neisseria sp. MVDL19-042950]MDO1516757.1 S-methyl-5'-thioinosine phosphorylase [Neisseria sp. MVDL18-041461]MDO1563904.1 S-methyl-5'-thioinosine phosphorylase [Neisseria sp. MVDL20-010259]
MIAVIGGSSLTRLPELNITDRRVVRTPYGLTSSPLLFGKLGSRDIVFLARHGLNHSLAPHEIDYRANIWALHSIGAERIVSVASVATLTEAYEPGSLVVPDDLVDYTHHRHNTFFEGQSQEVVHIDFSEPYDAKLRQALLKHAASHGTPVYDKAVYGCIQGPRLPTRAEVRRYQNDGVDIIGMTGMPEAALARELELPYVHLCGVTGIACMKNGPNGSDTCGADARNAIEKIRRLLVDL